MLGVVSAASLAPVRRAGAQGTPHLAIDLPPPADPPPTVTASTASPPVMPGRSGSSAAGPAAAASSAAGLPALSAPAPPPSPPAVRGPTIRAVDVLTDGQTRDLLRNGFPARLHFRLELWHAGGFLNALDGRREWDVIVRYDPVHKRFRAARLHDDSVTVIGDFDQFSTLAAAVSAPYPVALAPGRGGRYYYNAVLDVEMLSLNDLDEVERWLRGELRPAVRGQRNPGGVLGRGLRTLFVRLLGAERRHYEARSRPFRAG